MSPHFAGALDDISDALDRLLEPEVLLGASAAAVVGNGHEVEGEPALAVLAGVLPPSTCTPFELTMASGRARPAMVGWPELDGDPTAVFLLADPFSFPVDDWLRVLDDAAPGLPAFGGLASGATHPGGNRLLSRHSVHRAGAVGVVLHGVDVRPVVSQGCRPVGQPFVVTRAEGTFLIELGGQPAYRRLLECAAEAMPDDRELMRHGLQIGVVVDERKAWFERGDFLVRSVTGADPESGVVAIGDWVEVGHTVQFHVRDGDAADEDLRALLADQTADAALLFTCNGRGRHLFGGPDHDARVVQELLGPLPVAGTFCAGEIGPVGGKNFVHGFTASLALFGRT